MITRMTAAAALAAALAVAGVSGAVSAQEPAEEAEPTEQAEASTPGSEEITETLTGTIVLQENELGRMAYFLDRGDGQLVELRFGPAWFWGELNPLHVLAQTQASIGGLLADDLAEQAAVLEVRTINGVERATDKPPWAGGPKVQGEVHPGYEGWSHGQANKAVNKPAKPPKPDKPGRPWPLPAEDDE